VIRERDLNAIHVCGPGHGGMGMVANTYLEGTYGEPYAQVARTEKGLQRRCRQFSFPAGSDSSLATEHTRRSSQGDQDRNNMHRTIIARSAFRESRGQSNARMR
jgi:hypothetical protein